MGTWHLGKRTDVSQDHKRSATASDIYNSAWIGSLFKPSSTAGISKNRRLKYDILKGKRSAYPSYWGDIMRGNPGFRFHDNQDSLFDRDLIHKREEEEVKRNQDASLKTEAGPGQIETVFETWADWGDSEDFGGLRDDAAIYPHLFDRTILTRVQKKDGVDKRNLMEQEKRNQAEDDIVKESKEKKNVEAEIKSIKKSLPDIKTDSSQTKSLKSSSPGSAWKTSLPNEFLFNPWAFDSLNYGR